MISNQDYANDIKEIRAIMERSGRYLSLTGWSGISAGVIGITGTILGYLYYTIPGKAPLEVSWDSNQLNHHLLEFFILTGGMLILSLVMVAVLTRRWALKTGKSAWNSNAKTLVSRMAAPLITGGVVVLTAFFQQQYDLLAPLTLVFYGLAHINASNVAHKELRYLGMLCIVLGVIGMLVPGYSLLLWGVGFGILNMVFGSILVKRYGQ